MTTGDLHATQELPADAEGDSADLLTVQETAQFLKVSVSWVYEHVRPDAEDRLPVVKLGKYLRFDRRDLRAYIDAKRAASRASAAPTLTSRACQGSVNAPETRRAAPTRRSSVARRRFQTGQFFKNGKRRKIWDRALARRRAVAGCGPIGRVRRGDPARFGGGIADAAGCAGENGRTSSRGEPGRAAAGVQHCVRRVRRAAMEGAGAAELQGINAARIQHSAEGACAAGLADMAAPRHRAAGDPAVGRRQVPAGHRLASRSGTRGCCCRASSSRRSNTGICRRTRRGVSSSRRSH